MNKLKLVNLSIYKFVSFYIGDKEVRNLLYTRWTTLRKIRPGIKIIKSFIRKHKTPVRLIYGNHDRIILSSVGEKFKRALKTTVLYPLFIPVTRYYMKTCGRNITCFAAMISFVLIAWLYLMSS